MIITVSHSEENQRLDNCLNSLLNNVSRSKLQNEIKDGNILVNNKVAKASYKLKEGDVIEFEPSVETENIILPQKIDLDIKYEDENMLVVNKPSGMLTHPTTVEQENTLVNALLHYLGENLSDINGDFRRGILHRLDRNTSGLLMVAKNNATHEFLANQIKTKSAIRKYLAVVKGVIKEDSGIINEPIGRHPVKQEKMAVTIDGKPSITEFKVIERFADATFVELTLKTGRTHQIRVHMSHMGHVVFNDTLYGFGKPKIKTQEQVLQAYKLKFAKPFSDEIIELEISEDEKLTRVLKYLRSKK